MTANKLSAFILSFLIAFSVTAQDQVAIGQWRSYLPYNTAKYVTQNPTTIFYASDFSLLEIDKDENSAQRLTKVNGLSDVEIQLLKHSPFDDKMVLVYENGNIDFVSDNGIINFPFVKQREIQGDKNIYDITFVAADRVFLSTGFGILELDPQSATATNDIRTGVPILSLTLFDGFFYAATEEGIYRAKDDPSVNLLDFSSNWKLLGTEEGFPADYSSRQVLALEDKLVADVSDTMMFFQNGVLDSIFHKPGFGFEFFSAEGALLILGIDGNNGDPDKIVFFEKNGEKRRELGISCISRNIRYAVEDEKGQIWIADDSREFRVLESLFSSCDSTTYEGPPSAEIWDIEVTEDELWVATGGFRESNRGNLFRFDGVLRLKENGAWEQYSRNTRTELLGVVPDDPGDDFADFVKVKVTPGGEKVWMGSYLEGLVEFDLAADTMNFFDESTCIGSVVGDPARSRLAGIALDDQENVWFTSYLSDRPFGVITKEDRNCINFAPPACLGFTELLDIVVDGAGNKWMRIANTGGGLLVFNEGDLNTIADDRCRVITENNSNLPSNDVLSLTVDLDGDVWVGTSDGVVIFQCGSQALDSESCPGFLQPVNVGGDNEFLLKGESVNAIAVDGANRKWFGTTNGMFLQSESGDELLASFNELNSPLFDNNIVDIDIRQSTGEVFVGTARGLQSIRTDATEGFLVNTASVSVFPNPVRPDYFGPIAIKGLARDANVKITDVNGQLVYETTALGGQAIWDGNDYNGVRAATGVYLVFSTSTKTFDNPDADMVGKILLIK